MFQICGFPQINSVPELNGPTAGKLIWGCRGQSSDEFLHLFTSMHHTALCIASHCFPSSGPQRPTGRGFPPIELSFIIPLGAVSRCNAITIPLIAMVPFAAEVFFRI